MAISVLTNYYLFFSRYSNVKQAPEEVLIDDDKENSQHIDDVANSLPEIFDQQSSYLVEMDNDMRDISEQLKDLHDGTKVFFGVGDEAEIQFNTG